MKKKKIPMRRCIACDQNRPKKELIRIVKDRDGHIEVDLTGKMNGRGAYICSDEDCLARVIKNKRLARTLEIDIPDEIYNKLKDAIIDSK
ncbi:RNase P modulator RnpM [Clostridium sp. Cult3]|uniref:RNase P modulator RnpM n=1 Tax=Clostridium sp. Cult3 TaxID=2079004 RepID=UPI001F33BC03|nr:YlxR family protein [Clostridium sp. Cult3]MCF6460503.1 DUF448 domain-containing protein [Clostridium sp. Cult3]